MITATTRPNSRLPRENKFGFLKETPLHYAYHIDAGRYATFLRQLAEPEGVTRVEGIVREVPQREDGATKSIVLESDQGHRRRFFCRLHRLRWSSDRENP